MERRKHQRLSKADRLLIKDLTKKGRSLRHISKIIKVGITTIYYHVRKFKPKQRKEFIVPLSDEKIGELIGAFAGDGSYYYSINDKNNLGKGGQHRIRYHLSLLDDMQYKSYLRELLIKLNLNPHIIIRKDYNSIDIAVSSLSYLNFIKTFLFWKGKKTYSVRLKRKVNTYSLGFLSGFARGLMDTDGYVEISNVSCACTSKELIKNLAKIFDIYGLKYKISLKKRLNRKDLYLIRVYRNSLEDYNSFIGFSNKYKQDDLNSLLTPKREQKI